VTVDVRTDVLITAQITDPRVIPLSVFLYESDQNGRPTRFVGIMNDWGILGDVTRGDGIFSLRTEVKARATGQMQFMVSAAFKGFHKPIISEPILLEISPPGIPTGPALRADATIPTHPQSVIHHYQSGRSRKSGFRSLHRYQRS